MSMGFSLLILSQIYCITRLQSSIFFQVSVTNERWKCNPNPHTINKHQAGFVKAKNQDTVNTAPPTPPQSLTLSNIIITMSWYVSLIHFVRVNNVRQVRVQES